MEIKIKLRCVHVYMKNIFHLKCFKVFNSSFSDSVYSSTCHEESSTVLATLKIENTKKEVCYPT